MDRLDKLSALALVVLALCTLLLVVRESSKPAPEGGGSEKARKEAQAKRYFDPNFDKKIDLVKKLMVAGNLENAEKLTAEILAAYPFEGMPYMLNGDIKLRRQDIVGAAIEYRKAIDLNLNFLDKKADEFQGKKIKKTVEESLTEIEAAIQNGDSSQEMKEKRNTMYYMLRKIAGSCS